MQNCLYSPSKRAYTCPHSNEGYSIFKPWIAHRDVSTNNWEELIMWSKSSSIFTNELEAAKQQFLLYKEAITSLSTAFVISIIYIHCCVISCYRHVLSGQLSADHSISSAAQHRPPVLSDPESAKRLTWNIKETSAAVIMLQFRHNKVPCGFGELRWQ